MQSNTQLHPPSTNHPPIIRAEGFVSFMASPAGRMTRAALGLAMISYGLSSAQPRRKWLALAGLLPLAAGTLDFCVAGPLLGGPLRGDEMRQALHRQWGFPQMGSTSAHWMSV